MKWTDIFGSARALTADVTLRTAADVLHHVGTLACMAGGAGFAVSYAMDESLDASYFGSANTTGAVVAGADIENNKYIVNASFPFKGYFEHSGVQSYQASDYVLPSTVRYASAILAGAGTLFRSAGASLKLLQQFREDQVQLKKQFGVDAIKPSSKEYRIATIESLLNSITSTTLAYTITSSALYYSGFIGSTYSLTYPSYGLMPQNTTDYQGPVNATTIPATFHLGQNATINLPLLGRVSAYELVNANATANVTYGGGLFFTNNNSFDTNKAIATVTSGVVGVSSYLGSLFFAKKTNRLRDERQADVQGFGYIQS